MESIVSRKGWIILLGVPALFVCSYVLGLAPPLLNLPLCAVKSFIGIDCPGCGLVHSFVFLSHCQLRKSIDFNPMGVIIAMWMCYLFIRTGVNLITQREDRSIISQKGIDILLVVFVFALFIQWIIKLIIIY